MKAVEMGRSLARRATSGQVASSHTTHVAKAKKRTRRRRRPHRARGLLRPAISTMFSRNPGPAQFSKGEPMPPVDPNEPMMTGENSFIRLSPDGGKTMSDRASHWRVLWCGAGAGHVLFLQSSLTDNKVRIYSDNIAVARWLQTNI